MSCIIFCDRNKPTLVAMIGGNLPKLNNSDYFITYIYLDIDGI